MRTLGGQPIVVADIRRTSLTLAADTFNSRAVSRTPRPSSKAARIRCTLNGVVFGLSLRLPDDRARSSPAMTPSRNHDPLELAEYAQHAEQHPAGWRRGVERLLVQVEVDVAGS
jgi:hypothetical protein